jgi:hypothetical protein
MFIKVAKLQTVLNAYKGNCHQFFFSFFFFEDLKENQFNFSFISYYVFNSKMETLTSFHLLVQYMKINVQNIS